MRILRNISLAFAFLQLLAINSSVAQIIPTDLPNLKLWLKSDSLILNGSNVSQWTDLSGNNNHIIQTDNTKQPLLLSNQLNNFPVVRFDGINDNLKSLFSQTYNNELTIFIVMRNNASNPVFIYDGGTNYLSMVYVSNKLYIQSGIPNMFYPKAAPFPFSIFQNEYTNTVSKIYENGLLKLSGTLPTPVLNGFTLGTRYLQDTYFFNGDIAEIFIYNSTLSSFEKNQVELYLRNKYVPLFSLGNDIIQNDFCPINLSAPVGFSNLLWSTGETTNTITASDLGTYWVEGTDNFGFVNRDTIQVSGPTISIPSNTNICFSDSVLWNPGLGAGYNYLWSTGETDSAIYISGAGTYSVQVTDALMCTRTSANVTFTIDTYAQTAFLGADTSLCADNLIALQVGAPETVNYEWNGTSAVAQPPFWVVDTTGNYFVETTNINGCIARDTIHVIVTGQAPIADFSFQNQCFGLPNSFADLSVGLPTDAVVLWNWDFGDGNLNNSQNPNHTYGTDSSFTVQLYVESAGGCGAFHTETVTVHAVPTAAFTKVGHCSGQSIQFTNSSVLGDAPISAFLWNFDQPWTGTANTSTVPTPFRSFDIAGSYNISLQVTDTNGCIDSVIIPLVINQAPTVAFTAADACASAPISFTNTSVVEAPATYLWDFGDLTSSILPLPVKFFSNIGVHTITLTATAGNGCVNTLQQQMNVNPNPVAAMNVGPMCMGTYTSLTDNSTIVSGSVVSSLWILNTTDSLTGPTNNFIFNSLGQQQVVLQVTSDMGCTAMANQFIDIVEELDASFTASTSIIAAGEPITFTSTTPTLSIVSWDFGDGNSLNFVSPTTYQYGSNYVDSTVTVSMFVSNVLGCMDTATMQISIQPMRLDLSLSNLYVQDINGFYTIGIELKNEGSITITHADLKVLLPDGPVASEVWNGILIPGASEIYIFNSTIDAYIPGANGAEAFLCATGVGFDLNNNAEVFLDNNKVCKNLVGEAVVLLPIYPNPASNNVTIELLVTLDADVSIELVDARGRLIKTILPTQSLAAGLYTYDVDISQIQAGTYFVRMRNGDVDAMNKLLITN